jgi:hypothetical protein
MILRSENGARAEIWGPIIVGGGLAAVGSAGLAISSAGNFVAGATQLIGAATGNVSEAEEGARAVTSTTSLFGFGTLIATGGDLNKASRAAGVEGMITTNPLKGPIDFLDFLNSARDAAGK